MRICYSEENDADFIRWTGNLLRGFIQRGEVALVRQVDSPELMLASIWRPHAFPAIPVVLVSNENWDIFPPHHPLDRYKAVLGIYPPPQPCPAFIPYSFAAVHFDEPIGWFYENRHHALAAPKSRFCCFVASNTTMGDLAPRRAQLARDLQRLGPVDCAGRAENNTGYLAPRGLAFLNWISSYKYMICLENSKTPGYITEKPLQAWLGGAIPIYDGGAKDQLNPEAFIDASGDVAGQIARLEADPLAYEAMRRAPLTPSPLSLEAFEQRFREQVLG